MSTDLKPVLARLAAGETLSEDQAEAAFDVIMSGDATQAQIGALLMAMRLRGETVAEITGAVRAMRSRMTAIEAPEGTIDVCGTGGDGAHTLNISTAVASCEKRVSNSPVCWLPSCSGLARNSASNMARRRRLAVR